ncbi:hypothetical protein DTO271D3_7240 [Paecilomyces variotii]|nr:hypothetical protein DTO271D3_7240 [Paecilomyces variotii]
MSIPPTYKTVLSHLDQVLSDPSVPLDGPAIEKLKAEFTQNTDRQAAATLLTRISQLLPVLQEDPTPLTTLGIKATEYFSFSDVRSVDPPVNLIAGIKAPSPPVNLLALSLLGKAGRTPSDAAIVAGNSELVSSLVQLWLSTSATAVSQAAFDVLWSLLEVDHASQLEDGDQQNKRDEVAAAGQGLMWRRVFGDKDVYGLFFSICGLADALQPGQLTKRERTVAQGRLMDFIVKAALLRWDAVSESHIADIEAKYKSSSLLHFAACRMVDTGDVLMHMTLLNFYRELLQVNAPGLAARNYLSSTSTVSSPALDFLEANGLHSTLLGYYLSDGSQLEITDLLYLSSPIMAYVAQYAQMYPNHLLQNSQETLDKILEKINRSFSISSAEWAHGTVPTGDLIILSCLPRVMLVEAGRRSLNPLSALPTNPPNKECYEALARIFQGPPKPQQPQSVDLSNPSVTPTNWQKEAAAARVLYFTYLNSHTNMWTDATTAADIVAMPDVALAALSLMKAVITANWQPLSQEADTGSTSCRFRLPTEDELGRLSPSSRGILPLTGFWAVLTPPALTSVLPYLFKPPRSYANFVGGGRGDTESAVWRIATAKYDVLVSLHTALKENRGQMEGFDDVVRTLAQRVAEGPGGPISQAGSRVDALEL